MNDESMLDLIAHINEDAALIESTEALAPMAAAALARLRERLRRLDVLATMIEVATWRQE